MTTTIYLVRHCEATGNRDQTVQGHSDNEVTDRGRQQLERLSGLARELRLDAIYSSNLRRAVTTSQALNQYYGYTVQIDPGVTEIDFGVWEGMKWTDVAQVFPEEYNLWEERMYDLEPPGGEKVRTVYQRMRESVMRIARENVGKTIAIAGHGCAMRAYLCAAKGWEITQIYDVPWIENTGVCRVDYDDAFVPKVIYINRCDHLSGGLETPARASWQK